VPSVVPQWFAPHGRLQLGDGVTVTALGQEGVGEKVFGQPA
jgi:hypothetical protein